jgi:hypothetical protein
MENQSEVGMMTSEYTEFYEGTKRCRNCDAAVAGGIRSVFGDVQFLFCSSECVKMFNKAPLL